jgi:hypothetical protein
MGWSSYYEDILERMSQNSPQHSRSSPARERLTQQSRRAAKLNKRFFQLSQDIDRLLSVTLIRQPDDRKARIRLNRLIEERQEVVIALKNDCSEVYQLVVATLVSDKDSERRVS